MLSVVRMRTTRQVRLYQDTRLISTHFRQSFMNLLNDLVTKVIDLQLSTRPVLVNMMNFQFPVWNQNLCPCRKIPHLTHMFIEKVLIETIILPLWDRETLILPLWDRETLILPLYRREKQRTQNVVLYMTVLLQTKDHLISKRTDHRL